MAEPNAHMNLSDRMAIIEIDARGVPCPGPIVEAFEAINEAQSGDIINIQADDRGFIRDIQNLCSKTGNELLTLDDGGEIIKASIRKV